jgi:LPS-assembly protein
VDTIDTWGIMRLGTRQTLQTRRNNGTFEWMSLDTFFDVNFENPYSDGDLSNLFNIWTFAPVPWLSTSVAYQLPLVTEGFTEIDARINYLPVPELAFSVGMAYINETSFSPTATRLPILRIGG